VIAVWFNKRSMLFFSYASTKYRADKYNPIDVIDYLNELNPSIEDNSNAASVVSSQTGCLRLDRLQWTTFEI